MSHPAIASTIISHTNGHARRPYDPGAFANREDALREIESRVIEGQDGKEIRQSVMLAWGLHGVGKSWFLQHIEHSYALKKRTNHRKGVFAVLADFGKYGSTQEGLFDILGGIVAQIESGFQSLIDPYADEVRAFWRATSGDSPDGEALAGRFVDLINALSEDYVPILLFDSLENVEAEHFEFFTWFEENVWAPLARWDRVILVLASRREIRRFRQWEVRRRLKKLPLSSFSPKDTIKQIGNEPVGTMLYSYTNGHPFANWRVFHGLEQLLADGQPFNEAFLQDRNTAETIKLLLTAVKDWLLVDVKDPALARRLEVVATLRYFHIRSLQLLLADVEENAALSKKSDVYFQRLIGDMSETNLVRWSMQWHGYEVDSTVRHIFNRTLVLQNDAEYVRRHKAALDLHANWIEEVPWNSDRALIEATYHLGAIVKAKPEFLKKAREELTTLLTLVLGSEPTKLDLERIDTLSQLIEKDEELQDTSPPLYDMLVGRVNVLSEQVAALQSNL